MHRGDLTNEPWERLIALLPPQKPTTGRPAHDHRTIRNGILWILRTGAPWRDLPDRYGPCGPWPAASTAGAKWAFFSGFWTPFTSRPMDKASATGPSTISIVPSSAPTSMRLGPKRGPRGRSVRAQPGRLQPQDPSPRRGPRQADDLSLAPWAAPRGSCLCAPQAAGRGE